MIQQDALLQRAVLLIKSHRYTDASSLLRQYLAAQPDDPDAVVLLSECLLQQDKPQEAMELVNQALKSHPTNFSLFIQAAELLNGQKEFKGALEVMDKIEYFASNRGEYWTTKAQSYLGLKEYQQAREAATEALAINASDEIAASIVAYAEMNQGKKEAAYANMEAALKQNPGNSYHHANMGWLKLQGNQIRPAQEHFRESLRLDPMNASAREGMIKALQAKNPVYRLLLAFFFWMGSMKAKSQWIIIIGAYVGIQLLSWVGSNYPALSPFITPVVYAYVAFVLLSWAVEPLANGVLYFDSFGRYALTERQKTGALITWPAALLGLGSGLAYLFVGNGAWLALATVSLFMLIPLSTVATREKASLRRRFAVLSFVIGGLGLIGVILPSFINGAYAMNGLGSLYIIAVIGFQFYANTQH